MAIARVLNRTLVIPHFECLCDRSEYPDIMPSCIYQGGPRRLQLPFRCSTHFVTDTHKLQLMSTEPTRFGMQPHKFGGRFTAPLSIRAYSFLSDPRTDPQIKASIVDVHVGSSDGAVTLPHKATNVEVLARLQTPGHEGGTSAEALGVGFCAFARHVALHRCWVPLKHEASTRIAPRTP